MRFALTTERLARYQVGKTVVERSFVSTSPDGVVDTFRGSVEFRTRDAQGADLSEISESRDEKELIKQGPFTSVIG